MVRILVDCQSRNKIGLRLKLYLSIALLLHLQTCWSKDGSITIVKHDAVQLGSLSGYESWSFHTHTACTIPAASVLQHLVMHSQ